VTLTFFVATRVAAQGSKRNVAKAGEKPRLVEQSKYVAPFRRQVRATAEEVVAYEQWQLVPRGVPVRVDAEFVIARPKKPKYDYPPAPDSDKALRALNDALAGVVFADDSQVVGGRHWKRFAEADEQPGVRVSVEIAA